jgi:hypothetical protein
MKAYMEVMLLVLTSTLNGSEWSTSGPPPMETAPDTHWIRDYVALELVRTLCSSDTFLVADGNQTPAFQPVARPYTHLANLIKTTST